MLTKHPNIVIALPPRPTLRIDKMSPMGNKIPLVAVVCLFVGSQGGL
jgi:hypothetical protein